VGLRKGERKGRDDVGEEWRGKGWKKKKDEEGKGGRGKK